VSASTQRQVFQTDDPKRWKRFRLAFVAGFSAFVLMVAVAVISVKKAMSPSLPRLEDVNAYIRLADSLKVDNTTHNQFRHDLDDIRKKHLRNFYRDEKKDLFKRMPVIGYPVRAGFFVNWDPQSFYSLKTHASAMNMVLPEWFFVQDTSDEVFMNIDQRALRIMRENNLAIVPMITNYFNKWNGGNVHRIISSPRRKTKFIQSVVAALKKYRFQGVNIDFEELTETTDEYLIAFQFEFYKALHAEGFIVTQDVSPFNADYNYRELSRCNDFLFLMGYDQHNEETLPGNVAGHQWVENALQEITDKIPQEKVVLCVAAFGYDWPKGFRGNTVTYQEAIMQADDNDAAIAYNNNDYNLHYQYADEDGIPHSVYFTDAATLFNAMRASEDFGTSGVAVWRLGSEDERMWKFYPRNLSLGSLTAHPFDFTNLQNVTSTENIDYIGEGEILNILSAPRSGRINMEIDSGDALIAEETYISLPTDYVVKKWGSAPKKIVLTFDDGPDEDYTPRITSILKSYKVPAAFFITGVNAIRNIPLLKQLYRDGYEIGNHTFTHTNLEIASDSRIKLELRTTRRLIEAITNHSTILFRPPYNADAEPATASELHALFVARQDEYICVGSSIDPRDWEHDLPADSIYARAVAQRDLGNVILLHDAGGDREETIKALPRIIEYYQQHGYQFVSISELINMPKDQLMPKVKGSMNILLLNADKALASFTWFQEHFLSFLFFIALILVLFRIGLIALLVMLRKKNDNDAVDMRSTPVSVIVPAYNEEVNAVSTVENLLKSTHPSLEIIFVDDGSTDRTLEKITAVFTAHPQVKIFSKTNAGKASAINYGIDRATSGIVVCIDADTKLAPDAISHLLSHFDDENVASVAGNVKVGNKINLLTRWQSIEYTTSQNFDRLAFDTVNAIMVVPGAIGAFRKSAVKKAGGFSVDTLAEDCDITMKLLECGYTVRANNKAIAYTEAPETLRMFLKQRRRWSFGIMQSFWKHRRKLFSLSRRNMGWFLLPNMLVYQLMLPLFSPLVDLMLLVSLVSGKTMVVIALYFGYMLIDIMISAVAYYIDRGKIPAMKLLLIIPQRIIYRQLLFLVLCQSYLRAVRGELVHWGILKRTGNAKVEPA
jgi:cellulose synthase/poly-beta-1,6-N-acetylglucosamine synthase-like glycosyltransferase/spore germination protein YaaH/peptidoglycan/xylan/chitin deacetylase (PgdA/CDA1 family)